jgi:hypothetical protein
MLVDNIVVRFIFFLVDFHRWEQLELRAHVQPKRVL